MATTCTVCEGTGFINLHLIDSEIYGQDVPDCTAEEAILKWMKEHDNHDVAVCRCCGDGDGWYGVPGEHYNADDPRGDSGPYAYNGGLCECN